MTAVSLFHRTDSLVQQALNCCSTNSASTRGRLMEMIGHFISSLALGTVCTTVMYRWEQSRWNNRNPRKRHYPSRKRWIEVQFWPTRLQTSAWQTGGLWLTSARTRERPCIHKNGLFGRCWPAVLNVLDGVTSSQTDNSVHSQTFASGVSASAVQSQYPQGGIHEG